MSALFTLPKQIPLSAGAILPGAKLTFSQTLTSTLQNTYQDNARVTPHANPVVADSNGVFAPIYLDPTLPDYRVKLTTSADVLVYQADGIPSNQNTQQSMRLESTNPFVFLYDTDGTSGSRKYRIRAAGDAWEVQSSNDAESVFTTILQFRAGILYSNATEVAVTSSGTFTGTLTGMAGATTGTINYRKVNNLVSLWTSSTITGTSNATDMTMTGLPVALRPTASIFSQSVVVDNGNANMACGSAIQSTGTIVFVIAKSNAIANFVQYLNTGFTNSGSKGLPTGWAVTYPLS